LNGSGKHNNWSINTEGVNLFSPGKTKDEQIAFIFFVAALVRTIHLHGDIVRISVAHAGNDHRLGGQEAPPCIISLYTGVELEKHLNAILNGGSLEGYGDQSAILNFGSRSVFEQKKNVEDRNRTASFPFCGNRFEFRAVGSSQNIAWPLALLNTSISDSLSVMAGMMDKGMSVKDTIVSILKDHMKAVFTGNGYSQEWREEAKKRELWILPTTVDALAQLNSEKNIKLFESQKILRPRELEYTSHVLYENYIKTIQLEVHCLLNMITTSIIPACMEDLELVGKVKNYKAFSKIHDDKEALYENLVTMNDKLYELYSHFPEKESLVKQAEYCSTVLMGKMAKVREVVDTCEKLCTHKFWPYSKYENILYDHHLEGENEFKHGKIKK